MEQADQRIRVHLGKGSNRVQAASEIVGYGRQFKYRVDVSIQLYRRLKEDELWGELASLADHLLAHEGLQVEKPEEAVAEWPG